MKEFDVVINGGGLVGASMACALSGQGLRIAMAEAVQFESRTEPGYDDRTVALAQGSQRIFAGMGLWEAMAAEATPIHRIHVSDRGHFGFTRMDREEEALPALGYVIPARVLGRVLGNAVAAAADVKLYSPARLDSFTLGDESVSAEILQDDGVHHLSARLLVAADGAGSVVRERLQIPVSEHDYGQVAVITNITAQLPHHNTAFERFTDTGPLAVLPMSEQRCAVVWTVEQQQAEAVLSLSDTEFLARLQERFGYRLGRLERVGRRQAFPLRFLMAREPVQHRLALVGNAIHTLHPIAGQGFNLGVRDIAVLAEVLVDALRAGQDPGALEVLQRYGQWRRSDHRRVATFTDALARMFTLPLPGLGAVRNTGMLMLDLLPPAKRALTRLTMGRSGRVPRLARGLPL